MLLVGLALSARLEDAGCVLTPHEAVDDAVAQGVQAARASVVFREHPRHTNERQGTFALPAVQVTVAARHLAWREPGGFARRVREDAESPADLFRQRRVVQCRIGQRILRKVPSRDHRCARRNQRAAEWDARRGSLLWRPCTARRAQDGRQGEPDYKRGGAAAHNPETPTAIC